MNPNPNDPKASREGEAVPEGYEIVSADFLRQHRAVKGLKVKVGSEAWRDSKYAVGQIVSEAEACMTDILWCAPIGTIATATTPLPVRECDCFEQDVRAVQHEPTCALLHPYRHILPHALAALDEKPKGLIYANIGQSDWIPCDFPFPWKITDADSRLAYAIPVQAEPAPTRQEGEGRCDMSIVKAIRDRLEWAIRWISSPDPTREIWHTPDEWLALARSQIEEVNAIIRRPAPTAPPEPTNGQGEATDSEIVDAIRELCGYVEDGSSQAVIICQDDATKEWFVTAGKKSWHGSSLRSAIRAAMKGEGQ